MTAANWVPLPGVGTVAPSANDDLLFPSGAAQAATSNNDFAAGTPFHSITLDGAGYNFTGNQVLLGAGGLTANTLVPAGPPAFAGVNSIGFDIQLGAGAAITNTYSPSLLQLTGAVDNNGFTLTYDGSGPINQAGSISGGGGVLKNGPGQTEFQTGDTYAGPTIINGGILEIANGGALGSGAAGTTVNTGATLELLGQSTSSAITLNGSGVAGGVAGSVVGALELVGVGFSATVSGPVSLGSDAVIADFRSGSLALTNTVALNGHTLTVNVGSGGTTTLGGNVTNGSAAGNLVVNGALTTGTVLLSGASTYTGSTTVAGGTLDLTGTLASTSYTVATGGTLLLDDAGLTTSPPHVPQTAPISLTGGTLTFAGSAAANESETLGAVTLTSGHSNIRVNPAAGSTNLAQLTAASLTHKKGATVNFGSTATLGGASAKLFFSAAPTATNVLNGRILPYATVNDTDLATDTGFFNVPISAFTGYVTNPANLATVATNSVVKLTSAATLSTTTTLAGLLVSGTSLTMTNANVTINDNSGGLLLLNGASVNPLSGALGTVNFGGAEGFIFANASGTADSITTTINGSGGIDLSGPPSPNATSLVLDPGVFSNNYTGGTFLDSANVSLKENNVLGAVASSPVTFVGGALSTTGTATTPYEIDNAVNFTGAQTVLNTFVNFKNSTVTLSGSSAVTVSGQVTILDTVGGPVTAPLTVLGSGTLVLNPQGGVNSYTGATILDGATLVLGSIQNPLGASTSPLILSSGTLESNVTGAPIPNPVTLASANVTLGGASPNNAALVFGGTGAALGTSTLQVVVPTTFLGAIAGSGGITEQGTGGLVLGGNDTYGGSTLVTAGSVTVTGSLAGAVGVSGGTLFGAGATGTVMLGPSGTLEPLNPGNGTPTDSTLQAPQAIFAEGGSLTIPVGGYATPGSTFGQVILGGGNGPLVLGQAGPTLTLDLGGLPAGATGQALGAIALKNVVGSTTNFSTLRIINNPFDYAAALQYTPAGVNIIISQGFNVNQPPPAPTTTFIWTGLSKQSPKWSDPSNWLGGVAPNPVAPPAPADDADDLIFPAGAGQITTNFNDFSNATFHSITVEAGGYVLSGNALNLQNNLTATEPPDGTNPTVTVATPITLSPSFQDGNRSPTFVSTYAGTTLSLTGTTTTTQITTSVNGFGRNTDLVIDGAGDTTVGDQVVGPGGVRKLGTGTLFLAPTNSSGNTFTGGTDLRGGITALGGGNPGSALGVSVGSGNNQTRTVVNSGATLRTSGSVSLSVPLLIQGSGVGAPVFGNSPGAIDETGTGTLTLTAPLSLNGSFAEIDVSSPTAGLTISGGVNLTGATLTINSLGPVLVPSSIDTATNASTGSVVFNGSASAVMNLTAVNNFQGSLVVNSGTVLLNGGGTLAAAGSIQLGTSVLETPGTYAGGVGTLIVDDSASALTRLVKTTTLFLQGGDFTLKGLLNGATTETLAAITLVQGQSFVQEVLGPGVRARLTLNFDHITQSVPTATFDLVGNSLGVNNLFIWTNTNSSGYPAKFDNILPWGTSSDSTLSFNRGFLSYTILGNNTLSFAPASPNVTNPNSPAGQGSNVVLLDAALPTYVPLTITAATTFGALILRDGAQLTVNPGASLTLNFGLLSDGTGTNGIVAGAGTGADPVLNFGIGGGTSVKQGIVTAYAPLTLSTAISDGPGGATTMAFGGESITDLAPPSDAGGNTWTGGTVINAGTTLLDSTGNPFGGGAVTFTSGALSVNTVNAGSSVTINNPVVFSNSNFEFASKTGAALALAFGAATSPAGTVSLASNADLAIPQNVTLTINDQVVDGATVGTLLVTGGGGGQTGAGTLVLADKGAGGANKYSGGTILIDQGTNVPTLVVADNSALGTGLLTLISGTFETSAAAGVTIPNTVALEQSNVTLGGASPNNGALTFSGTVQLTGVNQITTAAATTFSGKLTDAPGGGGGGTTRGSLNAVGNLTLSSTETGTQTGQTSVVSGTLQLDGGQSSSPVPVNQGTMYGNGRTGFLAVSSTGVLQPGTPTTIGQLTATGANFSDGGTLRLRVTGFTTPGVDFDRLNLGSGPLIAGGTSRLILDLSGLTVTQVQTISKVIAYTTTVNASPIGNVPAFNEIDIVNNPLNFAVEADYTANGLNLKIGLGITDAPVLTVPAAQTGKEYFPLTFSAANGNAITVTDAGAAISNNPLQVTLSVTSGTLTLLSPPAGTIGNGSANVSFSDFAGNVTGDLDGLIFQPAFGSTAPVNLSVSVTDQATSGLLGPTQTASGTVPITITFIPFAPSFTPGGDVTVNDTNGMYSAPWATNILGLPPNGSTAGLTFSVTPNTPGLFSPTGQPAISPTGVLTFTPIPGRGGNAAVTVTLNTAPDTQGKVFSSNPVTFFIHVISTGAPTINDEIIHWGTRSASVNTILAYSSAVGGTHPDVPFAGITAIDLVFSGKVTVSNTPNPALLLTGTNPITHVLTHYTLAGPIPVTTPAGDTGFTLEWRVVGTSLAAVSGNELISLSLTGAQVINSSNNKPFSGNFSYGFQVLIGDVNGDGVVNLQDELAIARSLTVKYAGLSVLMDLDGDGSISMQDYFIAQKRQGNHSF
jgi:autotransporter-associated beta strand protein